MQEEQIIYIVKNLYNNLIQIFVTHTAEFVLGVLALSIGVVIISVIYVLIYKENSKANVRKTNLKRTKKATKIKYSKDFLKRVDGVDLNLK
tara:strand:+ start:717 stop:989 length:273 start_codon:yes stop_codon:yes gene_type:complete